MSRKKLALINLLLIFLLPSAICTTWTTVSEGYWNNPLVWSGGTVPSYTCSDTFLIKHYIAFTNNIELNAGAFIFIDSIGGLCAHRDITVNTGARIIAYGLFEVDSLFIRGGQTNYNIPGAVILWRSAIISNGGSFNSNCSFSVGPWFDCRRPEYDFTGLSENANKNIISIFPNPTSFNLNIEAPQKSEIEILNIEGQIIKSITANENNTTIDISDFARGMYFVYVITENGIAIKKFIKE
jgi:hypothetical protein